MTIGIVPMTSAMRPTFTPRSAARYKVPNCTASDRAPTTALCSAVRARGHAAALSCVSTAKISPAPPKRSTSSVNGAP